MTHDLHLVIDIDVILDVLAKRQPHYDHSARLWAAIESGFVTASLVAHSATTIHYLLSRQLDRVAAADAIQDLLRIFDVAPVDGSVLREALGYGWGDFEDAVQMAAARAVDSTHMITRNTSDYRDAPIPVLTPAEILPLLVRGGDAEFSGPAE